MIKAQSVTESTAHYYSTDTDLKAIGVELGHSVQNPLTVKRCWLPQIYWVPSDFIQIMQQGRGNILLLITTENLAATSKNNNKRKAAYCSAKPIKPSFTFSMKFYQEVSKLSLKPQQKNFDNSTRSCCNFELCANS